MTDKKQGAIRNGVVFYFDKDGNKISKRGSITYFQTPNQQKNEERIIKEHYGKEKR